MTRAWVGLMLALTLFYVLTLFGRGVILIQDPSILAKLMGFAILVLPVFAIWGLYMELSFGYKSQRLTKKVQDLNLPGLDLELRPSGRATKESAASELLRITELAEASPESWTNWFLLGEANEAAGNRKQARACMRKAILLADKSESPDR